MLLKVLSDDSAVLLFSPRVHSIYARCGEETEPCRCVSSSWEVQEEEIWIPFIQFSSPASLILLSFFVLSNRAGYEIIDPPTFASRAHDVLSKHLRPRALKLQFSRLTFGFPASDMNLRMCFCPCTLQGWRAHVCYVLLGWRPLEHSASCLFVSLNTPSSVQQQVNKDLKSEKTTPKSKNQIVFMKKSNSKMEHDHLRQSF